MYIDKPTLDFIARVYQWDNLVRRARWRTRNQLEKQVQIALNSANLAMQSRSTKGRLESLEVALTSLAHDMTRGDGWTYSHEDVPQVLATANIYDEDILNVIGDGLDRVHELYEELGI